MASRPFEIIDIDGLTESNRRGIVFLTRECDPHLDAAGVFAELSVKADRQVRSRFDYWIDGGINDNYFHGWNDQKHRDCFSF